MKLLILIISLLAIIGTGFLKFQGKDRTTQLTKGETVQIKSSRLGEEREVQVYLPASYNNSNQRYPVIYTLDGEGTGPATAGAVEFMTSYSELPQMPEAIVVGITNTNRNRDMPVPQEYGKSTGQENFLAFLADELIPSIEQKYRTQPLRILVGHSQGGLFTYYAMTARPKVFQWYLPVDAPLSGFPPVKPLMGKVRMLINNPPNYRGRLVAVENLYGWLKEWPMLVNGAPKSFYGARVIMTDETHETMFYKSVYEGLKRLFHDYAPETKDANLVELETKYKLLSKDYGYQVDIPQQVLIRSAVRNTQKRDGAEASRLIQRIVTVYGESPTTKHLMANAEEAVKEGGPDPRLAEWAKLSPPDIESIKPFLGTWERTSDDGAHMSINFEIKNGIVQAQYSLIPPDGKTFQLEVRFVKVIDEQTVQFGLLNGLGGGIILHTAKLMDKNTLKGEIEKVGIPEPPNAPGPPKDFIFKRRSVMKK